jgi:hypothetical protein
MYLAHFYLTLLKQIKNISNEPTLSTTFIKWIDNLSKTNITYALCLNHVW